MTDRDPLAAFDEDLLEDPVREAARRHQSRVRELPGVENLVYEWRRTLDTPLVERTPGAYVLVVPERVWAEFDDAADRGPEAAARLHALHGAQARRIVDDEAALTGGAPIVLTRT